MPRVRITVFKHTKAVTCFFNRIKLNVRRQRQYTFGGEFPNSDTLIQTRVLTNQRSRTGHVITEARSIIGYNAAISDNAVCRNNYLLWLLTFFETYFLGIITATTASKILQTRHAYFCSLHY